MRDRRNNRHPDPLVGKAVGEQAAGTETCDPALRVAEKHLDGTDREKSDMPIKKVSPHRSWMQTCSAES